MHASFVSTVCMSASVLLGEVLVYTSCFTSLNEQRPQHLQLVPDDATGMLNQLPASHLVFLKHVLLSISSMYWVSLLSLQLAEHVFSAARAQAGLASSSWACLLGRRLSNLSGSTSAE